LLIRDRRPNQPVHVLHRLDLCLDNAHPIFTIPLQARIFMAANIL
jgi:hypothetical protein